MAMGALLLTLAAAGAPELEAVAAALRAAPAWEVSFTQRYIPAGFTTGTEETGTLTLRPPDGVRFEYQGRVFAVEGDVARVVDREIGTCEAIRLTADAFDRLPLSAILDPATARATFAVHGEGTALTLTPRRHHESVARVEVYLGAGRLPSKVVIVEHSGTRNEFRFQRWRRRGAPPPGYFLPALPGQTPCDPEDG